MVAIACAVSAYFPAHALASVQIDDAAATRAYLSAADAYEFDASAELPGRIASIEAHADEIGSECPAALTYAPRDTAFEEVGEELYTTVFFAATARERPMLLRLAHTIEHLSWSNRRLTGLVRAEAAEERAIATLALPDVCADIAAWKASGYAALPQSATKFLARVQAIESLAVTGPSEESRETAIMRLLRPYETPAQRRIARHIERLEAQVNRRLNPARITAEKKLAAAFGVAAL
jgi:hypothetical protein